MDLFCRCKTYQKISKQDKLWLCFFVTDCFNRFLIIPESYKKKQKKTAKFLKKHYIKMKYDYVFSLQIVLTDLRITIWILLRNRPVLLLVQKSTNEHQSKMNYVYVFCYTDCPDVREMSVQHKKRGTNQPHWYSVAP